MAPLGPRLRRRRLILTPESAIARVSPQQSVAATRSVAASTHPTRRAAATRLLPLPGGHGEHLFFLISRPVPRPPLARRPPGQPLCLPDRGGSPRDPVQQIADWQPDEFDLCVAFPVRGWGYLLARWRVP